MPRFTSPLIEQATSVRALGWLAALLMVAGTALAEPLKAITVGGASAEGRYITDATVEAVRDARVVSPVPGRIVALPVRAGERVQAGQVLARIEASVIGQQVVASQAQLAQVEAQAVVARKELQRARQLSAKAYISQAALEQAEAQSRAADAQVKALQAQVAATSAQAGLHVLHAPFAGWVAQVPVSLGDAAGPGQVLMQVYDPGALRVTAQVPESVAPRLQAQADVDLIRSSAQDGVHATESETVSFKGLKAEVLPAVDPVSRTVTLRVALPVGVEGFQPGQSVKLSLPWRTGIAVSMPNRLFVPRGVVVTRGELQGVYVLGQDGSPRLRQVRLGRAAGESVEVLAGLAPGERVALDPVAAARQAASPRR